MADDDAVRTAGIISALGHAGLLRTAPASSEPAAQIIAALSEAGLLRTAATTSETAVPGRAIAEADLVVAPPPEPKVGDEAFLGRIRQVSQLYGSGGRAAVTLVNNSPPQWQGTYFVNFPPNDTGWLEGIDAIIATSARERFSVTALVKITKVVQPRVYEGKLTNIRAELLIA